MSTLSLYLTRLKKSDSRLGEIIRYGITGGIATVIQIAAYLVLVSVFNLYAELSTVASYIISFLFNFFLSNFFTFHTRPNIKKAFSFASSHLINLSLQTLLVSNFKDIVGDEYALIPAMAICIPINFVLVRFALTNKRFQSLDSGKETK